ncbi:hypothetical protein AZE42_08917 [Rhizopogon vesiculosus]|uniref:NAD-binding protein n=1 Tax=Rhizopogon vesiculosus TaxID=180088 RepID=A0A1J8PMX4_9AGAM|nr:hypothetical protein AZE42_08917 [Rhizopogon vesiculosus]
MSVSKGVALITGSAQGIGHSIALRLASDGFDIALNDMPTKGTELESLASKIESLGRAVCIVPANVSVDEQVKEMIDGAVAKLGGLDVMVSNAGVIGEVTSLVSSTVESWDHTFSVNARGSYLCYKYAAMQMIQQGRGGRIIGASSVAGKMGLFGFSSYTASKFAIRGLTQVAALELGKYGITVNSYAPSGIQTAMCKAQENFDFAPDRSIAKDVTDQLENAKPAPDPDLIKWLTSVYGNVPLKQVGQPEDIASIVSYLASKEAHFITGQCISVDGGVFMS